MNEQFISQMNFLKTYIDSFERKEEVLIELKERLAQLQPYVEEARKIQEEIDDINRSLRLDEKFFISMNDMVLRNTGQPISNGELFEQNKD